MRIRYVESSVLIALLHVLLLLAQSNLIDCSSKQLEEHMKQLDGLCGDLSGFKKISQLEQLIEVLKQVMRDVGYIEYQKYSYWNDNWKRARPCLMQADAIVALKPIVEERDNVCKSSQVDKIEAYHENYLPAHQKPPITSNFFHLYASQVAIVCKQNLLQSLNAANERLPNLDSYAKVMPWLSDNLDACESLDPDLNLLDGNKISGSEPGLRQAETQRQCNARQALSNVKSIYELVDSLGESQQSIAKLVFLLRDDNKVAPDGENSLNNRNQDDTEFILMVPEHDKQPIRDILDTCSSLKPVYENTILPIVRLISLGINPDFDKFNQKFDAKCRENKLIQQWFSITLVCDSMLKSRLPDNSTGFRNEKSELSNQNGLIIVEGEQRKNQNIELKNEPPSYLSYPIEDELWIGKFMSSRLAKLKSSFVKNIVRTFKIKELLNNVVFQKTVNKAKGVSVSLILVVLTLMGIDGSLFLPH